MPYRARVTRRSHRGAARDSLRSARGASRPAWLIGAALLALPVLWFALSVGGEAAAPEELHGTWTTDAPSYADRAFTITDSTVTFYQGGQDSTFHRLVGFEREADRSGAVYTLEYEQGGQTLKYTFEYSASDEIRIRNLEHMVWRRARRAP